MRTDEELMAAYVAGDEAAFVELFDRLAPTVQRLMRRQLFKEEEAYDLTQQSFLQLHRARFDWDPQAKLRPWLFTIAMNVKREHLRRLKRRPEAPLELDGRSDPSEGPRGPDRSDAARMLSVGLSQIPDDQREVIALHWLEGLPFPEVAVIVGASLSAVKVRAHRGYAALRKVLEHETGNPGPRPAIRTRRS